MRRGINQILKKYKDKYRGKDKQTNKQNTRRAGEMILPLRPLPVLPENPGLMPNIHRVAHNHLYLLVQKNYLPLLNSIADTRHVMHRHTQRQNIHTHRINRIKYSKLENRRILLCGGPTTSKSPSIISHERRYLVSNQPTRTSAL